jgi:hypothetical protein
VAVAVGHQSKTRSGCGMFFPLPLGGEIALFSLSKEEEEARAASKLDTHILITSPIRFASSAACCPLLNANPLKKKKKKQNKKNKASHTQYRTGKATRQPVARRV